MRKPRTTQRLSMRLQPQQTHMILYARAIAQPLTVFRCLTHTNHALASMVGLMGRDKDGTMVVERML